MPIKLEFIFISTQIDHTYVYLLDYDKSSGELSHMWASFILKHNDHHSHKCAIANYLESCHFLPSFQWVNIDESIKLYKSIVYNYHKPIPDSKYIYFIYLHKLPINFKYTLDRYILKDRLIQMDGQQFKIYREDFNKLPILHPKLYSWFIYHEVRNYLGLD